MKPTPTDSTFQKAIRILAVSLLLITALATRLTAPMRMDVVNDEMIHISNYHPDYESQKFLDIFNRILLAHSINPAKILRIDAIYNSSYPLQRLQYFIRDAHPPLFNVFAELVNCAPGYKLPILRVSAMIASLVFLFLLYLVGKDYAGRALGLWLSGMATVCFAFRIYAGLGRPYVFAQMMAALVLYIFLRRRHAPSATLRPFLLLALTAQATDWLLWPLIAPMILIVVLERWRVARSLWTIVKESWWYALSSLALLLLYRVQIVNPVISTQLETGRSLRQIFDALATASPFAELGSLSAPLTAIAALIFLLLSAIGLIKIAVSSEQPLADRCALVLSLLACVVEILKDPALVRIDMIPVTVLIFSAGVAVHMLLAKPIYSDLAFSALMALFLAIFLVKPQDPYAQVLDHDTRVSLIARQLSAEIKPGDIWFSVPYFEANSLYFYGAPPPLVPVHDLYSDATFEQCATVTNCYIYSNSSILQDPRFHDLLQSQSVQIYPYQNNFLLFRYPHRNRF